MGGKVAEWARIAAAVGERRWNAPRGGWAGRRVVGRPRTTRPAIGPAPGIDRRRRRRLLPPVTTTDHADIQKFFWTCSSFLDTFTVMDDARRRKGGGGAGIATGIRKGSIIA
jgi:hypothetical protein